MSKSFLATLIAAAFIITGCSAPSSTTNDNVSSVDDQQNSQSSATPTATQNSSPAPADPVDTANAAPADTTHSVHSLGETVDTPGGSSVTAYDYRVITTPGDEREGVLEVKVCIGDPVEGYEGGSVLTEFWSIEDADDRRFEAASSYGENDEVGPILSYESFVAWDDCIRGWIVMDTDDTTDAQMVRYFNSMTEEPGAEEIRWAIS